MAVLTLIMVASGWLVACNALPAPMPPTAKPLPTQQPLTIALPAALEPLRDALHLCAVAQPEIALLIQEGPTQQVDTADLFLSWGEPADEIGFITFLAWEEIAVILHSKNPVEDLRREEIIALFSGETVSWSEVDGPDHPVQPWVYPPGDDTRQIFDAAVLGEMPVSPQSILAADPEAMLEGIKTNPDAIGYVPRAWLDGSVRVLPGGELSGALRRPVLGLAKAEPQGAARSFLYCLQSGPGKEAVEEIYPP